MISAKRIRLLAEKKWDSRKWCDANRDILRHIYDISARQDRKINLEYFCFCAGISLAEAWKIGQLSQFRDDLKRRKYGQKLRRGKVVVNRDIFQDQTKVTDAIREQYGWRSVRDQRGLLMTEHIPILAIITCIIFLCRQMV